MSSPVTTETLAHAYRHLYRASLRAIRFARPARFEARDILREAFRHAHPSNFNLRRVENTVKFLENAQNFQGYEHRIIKNLLRLQYWKGRRLEKKLKDSVVVVNTPAAVETRKQIWHQYKATLTMLNESLDICLTI